MTGPATRVSDAESVLTQLSGEMAIELHKVFPVSISDKVISADFMVRRNSCVARLKLNFLSIKTTYSVTEKFMCPEFQPTENTQGFIFRECQWVPPATMNLFFAIKMIADGAKFCVENAVLFAKHSTLPGFWKLPLPNQYADGRICLGNTLHETRCPSRAELVQKIAQLLDTSIWNTDQMPTMSSSRAMFRFNPSTNETLPPDLPRGSDWPSYCIAVNNPIMGEAIP